MQRIKRTILLLLIASLSLSAFGATKENLDGVLVTYNDNVAIVRADINNADGLLEVAEEMHQDGWEYNLPIQSVTTSIHTYYILTMSRDL